MTSEIKSLIVYRLEQADESLESAQLLFDNNKFRPAVNRSYYAMFYAILALLAQTKQQTSKHSGAISLFDRNFVKTGEFTKEFSRWLHEAFDLRQQADYQELVIISRDLVEETLGHARIFVAGIKEQLKASMG